MTYGLAIIAPPEADSFSFAALSAANENNIFLCDLSGSSEAQLERDKRAVSVFESLQDCQIQIKCNLFYAPLSNSILTLIHTRDLIRVFILNHPALTLEGRR
jgi:hypothetical protein